MKRKIKLKKILITKILLNEVDKGQDYQTERGTKHNQIRYKYLKSNQRKILKVAEVGFKAKARRNLIKNYSAYYDILHAKMKKRKNRICKLLQHF